MSISNTPILLSRGVTNWYQSLGCSVGVHRPLVTGVSCKPLGKIPPMVLMVLGSLRAPYALRASPRGLSQPPEGVSV